MIEGIERIRITEDNTVDRGGCIIDTEYGSIDSRISIQMQKIEHLIREMLKSDNILKSSIYRGGELGCAVF